MRSIWNGSISFGLVNIPVKLHSATEEHDVVAHQVHAADGGRIRYQRVCQDCGEVVEYADLARGYEYGSELVVLTEAEQQLLPGETQRVIEVLEFVPLVDIDPMMLDKSYYLSPNKSLKAYRLLSTVLDEGDRVAIVKFVLRSREQLAILRVTGKQKVLTVQTMRWADEIRDPAFPELDKDAKVTEAELEVARELIGQMVNEFNPDRHRDTYQEALRELVAAKAEGTLPDEDSLAEAAAEAEVDDMLARLRASRDKVAG